MRKSNAYRFFLTLSHTFGKHVDPFPVIQFLKEEVNSLLVDPVPATGRHGSAVREEL